MTPPTEGGAISARHQRAPIRTCAIIVASALVLGLLYVSSRSATRALVKRRGFDRALLLVEDNSSSIAGAPPTVLVEGTLGGVSVLRSCTSWACVGSVAGGPSSGGSLAAHVSRNLHASTGVVLLFHSCAHTSKAAWLGMPRERTIVHALHGAGMHVVAFTSPARGSVDACWDVSPQPRSSVSSPVATSAAAAAAAVVVGAGAAPAATALARLTDADRAQAILAAVLAEAGPGVAPQLALRSLAAMGFEEDPWLMEDWGGRGGSSASAAAAPPASARFTHPVFAVGVASGGSFALHLATRLRLTGAVALAVSRPLPLAMAPLLQLPQPQPQEGGRERAPPRPTGPYLVEGGGGALAVDGGVAGGGGGRGAASPLGAVLASPQALPPLLLLPALPSDATLRPPISASLAAVVQRAGLPVAAGDEGTLWGVAPAAAAAAAFHVVATAAAAAGMADATRAAEALAAAAAAAPPPLRASGSAGASVLPLTPRPLCPWTLHTAAPWAVSPAASAALFQALLDAGALESELTGTAPAASRGPAAMQALRAAVGASLLQAEQTQAGGTASSTTGAAAGGVAAAEKEAAAAAAPIDPSLLSRFSRMAGRGAGTLSATSLAAQAVARLADALLLKEAPGLLPVLQEPQGAGVANKSALSVHHQQQHPEACLQDATALETAGGGKGQQPCFRLGLALSEWPPLGTRLAAAHDEGWASTQQSPSSGDAAVPVATALLPDASAAFAAACRALVIPPSAPAVGAVVAAWAAALAPAPRGAEDLLPTHEAVCVQSRAGQHPPLPAGSGTEWPGHVGAVQSSSISISNPLGASSGGADCWPAARERTGVAALDAAYWGVRVALATHVDTKAAQQGRRAAVVVPVVSRAAAASPASSGDTSSSSGNGGGHERGLAAAVARQVLDDLHGARGVATDLHMRAVVQWLAEAAAAAAPEAGP